MTEPGKATSVNSVSLENRRGTNTRLVPNKCFLKPGHSLMDWIRLGNSGTDLSGTGGTLTPVNAKELVKHNTTNNAWIAIRGKVYNVTRYLDFHPGGRDELMRGVGSDATKLFDEIHCWVNHDQLLSKCLIGPYEGRTLKFTDGMLQLLTRSKTAETLQLLKTPREATGFPKILPKSVFNERQSLAEIINFNWTQSSSDIVLYYYTSKFCNPGVVAQKLCDNNFKICILLEQTMYIFNFKLYELVRWPPAALKVSNETGKIEMSFTKLVAKLWPMYGTKTNETTTQYRELEFSYLVEANKVINHNSFQLSLKPQSDEAAIIVVPIGYHVNISSTINEESITRSYTPVPDEFLMNNQNGSSINTYHLSFLIKSYTSGLLSQHLRHLNNGSTIKLSQPKGGLKLQLLLLYNRFILLAAGSGLTPMLPLIEHLLERSSSKVEKVLLVYFNNTEEDIWCKNSLDNLQTKDDRFQIINILSKPSASWQGYTGYISTELMAPIVNRYNMECCFACICGSTYFNSRAIDTLKNLRFTEKNMFIFHG